MYKLTIVALMMSISSAFALPIGVERPIEKLSVKAELNGFDFEGIVKLSNCSGALVKFEGQPETMKAILMTNGHCAQVPGGFIRPGVVISNQPVSRSIGIFDSSMKLRRVKTTKYLYATMTQTDVAYYELEMTYKEIKDKWDIDAFTMADSVPSVGTEFDIVSGYWERGYACAIEAFIPSMREAGYTWLNSLRYTEPCETIGGTSGSPVIERNTRTVIAINNTGNESGQRCTMNNPCEVSEDGTVTVKKGYSYGQQTYDVYTCLNDKFVIDLKKPGCALFK